MAFRILSQEEFDRLTTKQRADYLREALLALEELKDQLRAQVMRDTGEHIREVGYATPDKD